MISISEKTISQKVSLICLPDEQNKWQYPGKRLIGIILEL